jgi:NADH:ubiquinone oxidoreductase subunit E
MLELSVCIGSSCHLKGSYNIIQLFQQMIEENTLHDKIDFKANFCMKECQGDGVAVSINGAVYHLEPEKARDFFKETIMPILN